MSKLVLNNTQIHREQIKHLAKGYNTLEHAQALRSMLKEVFIDIDFSNYNKGMLHRHFNDSLIAHYSGEVSLKYQLFCRVARKKLVAAFETKVENSRVDFLTVNGVSTSFEIKSELDNLDKLSKQALNYLKVFDYNYLVIDSKHKKNAIEMLPLSFGILLFDKGKRIVERNATLNQCIDPSIQISMLTKKELKTEFNGIVAVNEIRNRFTDECINKKFKEVLKSRYRKRWNFIVAHRNEILPIDLQFFFNRNIDPALIYNYG